MKRETIIHDAITYITELKKRVIELKEELSALEEEVDEKEPEMEKLCMQVYKLYFFFSTLSSCDEMILISQC